MLSLNLRGFCLLSLAGFCLFFSQHAHARLCSQVFSSQNLFPHDLPHVSTRYWIRRVVAEVDLAMQNSSIEAALTDVMIDNKERELAKLEKAGPIDSLVNIISGNPGIQSQKNKLQIEIRELLAEQQRAKGILSSTKAELLQEIDPLVRAHFEEHRKSLISLGAEFSASEGGGYSANKGAESQYEILSVGPIDSDGAGIGRIPLKLKDLVSKKEFSFSLVSTPTETNWYAEFVWDTYVSMPDYFLQIKHGRAIDRGTRKKIPHSEAAIFLAREKLALSQGTLDRLALRVNDLESVRLHFFALLAFKRLIEEKVGPFSEGQLGLLQHYLTYLGQPGRLDLDNLIPFSHMVLSLSLPEYQLIRFSSFQRAINQFVKEVGSSLPVSEYFSLLKKGFPDLLEKLDSKILSETLKSMIADRINHDFRLSEQAIFLGKSSGEDSDRD